MKIRAFSLRNAKEILRDPLSYIFCLGFPIAMLIIMTIVNKSIPQEANMDIFNLDKLTPAIAMFGFTFIMLFTAILISKDRESAFLSRLCGAPMKPWEFWTGYTLPVFAIALLQCLLTYAVSLIIAATQGQHMSVAGMLLSVIAFIPTILMFISIGIILGCLFSERAAPGIGSILITVTSILGGIWMDVEGMGGTVFTIAKVLPFYWSVEAGRQTMAMEIGSLSSGILVIAIYFAAAVLMGIAALKKKIQKI